MTNNYVNKLSYVPFHLVQNKVQWGGALYLLSNLNNKINNIIWIE